MFLINGNPYHSKVVECERLSRVTTGSPRGFCRSSALIDLILLMIRNVLVNCFWQVGLPRSSNRTGALYALGSSTMAPSPIVGNPDDTH